MRRFLLVAVLFGSLACSDGDDAVPPVFRVRSPLLFTFEGQRSGVSVEVDGRARFAVLDESGQPRGTGVAEQAGRYEIEFDPHGLPEDRSSRLDVVATSDSGGRARAAVTVRHGALGLEVLDETLLAAALLSDERLVVLAPGGLLLQASVGSSEFDGPLPDQGGVRTALTPGPDGDFFAAGEDDVVLHYDDAGELCETIRLLPTQTDGGDAPPSVVSDLASQFGVGTTEVMAAHDLGFSGFAFTGRPCAQDACLEIDDCPLDVTTGFSTGTCLTGVPEDTPFRATAVAMDGDRAYTGGYTLNVRSLSTGTNSCVDLQLPTPSAEEIRDVAVSFSSVWVAIANGITRAERGFEAGSGVARPAVERYGEGGASAGGLDGLPSDDVRTLTPMAAGEDGPDGVWFGTESGLGRIRREGSESEVAWISGLSLPGRSVRAILAPPANPGLLWVATDGGLARLLLPAEE